MPVLIEDNETKEIERSDWNIVRMQNLPWTACRADIKHFFHGLSVEKGGIVVRNFEAFVAFESHNDTRLALYRRNILLHGFKMELTIISKNELNAILFRIVRRKLDFDHVNRADVAKLHFEIPLRRKIRPTPVLKGDKQEAVLYSTFLPEETDSLRRSHATVASSFDRRSQCGKRSISGIRKVNPTRVADTMEMENLAIFHPEECYEVKKIKFEVSAVTRKRSEFETGFPI